KGVAIPGSEMEDLVPAEKQSFKLQPGSGVVQLGHPLRHSHVVGILGLKLKFQNTSVGQSGKRGLLARHSAVSRNAKQFEIAISNQPKRIVVTGKSRLRSLEYGSNQIVIEKRCPQ